MRYDPYEVFRKHHYIPITPEYLIPSINISVEDSSSSVVFEPIYYTYKEMSLLDKLKYYLDDLVSYLRGRM